MALCASGFAAGVAAQPQPPAVQQSPSGSTLERVEVTGSRIKRIDTETPSPVQVITREQIERSGAFSVTEVLKRTPAANAGSFDENAVASFTPGAGGVSLRGLGAQATLVLINGRRVSPFGFASGGQTTFVDVNQIPVDVVERIEVLLDGASAIYGSDAIGGVVNVILRKDFNGLQASGTFGRSTHGDADAKRGSITYGKGSLASDGYNFFVNYSHIDQDPVKANQRDRTQTADLRRFGLRDLRSSYAGNLYAATGASGGAFVGTVNCTPIQETGAAVNNRCYYAGTDHQDVIADSKRDSVTLAGTAALGRGFELFSDATFGRTKFKQESPSYSSGTYGPASTGTLAQNYIPLPVGHPQNPTNATVALRYRFADVPHVTTAESDTQRAVVGVRNPDLYGWDVESALLYSHSSTRINTTGLINDSVLLNEVLDANGNARPTFIFGNPSANDQGLLGRLYPNLKDKGTTTTEGIDMRGTRDIFALPSGSVALAVGAEVRHEKYRSVPDALTASGALSVLGSASSEGGRTVTAGYAELSIPIFKNLEASLAGRYDHYSDFGSTTNPKAGLKWKILPNLALRGTYATGFRAPAITELSQSPSRSFYSGIRDPRLCPDPNAVVVPPNPNCDLSIEAFSGSNPNLKPEKSKSLTAGLIFEPLDNLSIAFDYYRIKRSNEISSIDPDYLLANEANYPGFVVRNPDGTIKSLNLNYTNLGSTRVWGYDIDVKGSVNVGEIGKIGATLTYNRLPHYYVANVAGAPEVDYAGTYTQPTDRVGASVSLDRGPWKSSLTFNYTGKYLRAYTPADLSCPYTGTANEGSLCTVGSFLTTDLYVGYTGFKNLALGLTVINLDNRQPPIDSRLDTRYTLFNSTFHNDLGRYFQVSAKYTFW